MVTVLHRANFSLLQRNKFYLTIMVVVKHLEGSSNSIAIKHIVIALFCSLLSMCYIASIFHVLTHFRAATYHVADFSDDE